jgi:hypothetical protein
MNRIQTPGPADAPPALLQLKEFTNAMEIWEKWLSL